MPLLILVETEFLETASGKSKLDQLYGHHCVVVLTLVELDISELVFTASKDYEPSP